MKDIMIDMMKMKSATVLSTRICKATLLSLAFLVLSVVSTSAQMADRAELRDIRSENSVSFQPATSAFSLIDLSRIRWSHSYNLSYYSGSFGSGSYGLYTGSLLYEFSPSLAMYLDVGIGHNPGALVNTNQNSSAQVFPGIAFDYHPSKNFRVSVSFSRSPYSNSLGNYQSALYGRSVFYSPYSYFGPRRY